MTLSQTLDQVAYKAINKTSCGRPFLSDKQRDNCSSYTKLTEGTIGCAEKGQSRPGVEEVIYESGKYNNMFNAEAANRWNPQPAGLWSLKEEAQKARSFVTKELSSRYVRWGAMALVIAIVGYIAYKARGEGLASTITLPRVLRSSPTANFAGSGLGSVLDAGQQGVSRGVSNLMRSI